MADDIVLSAGTRAALQNLQRLQQGGAVGLKQALQSERLVVDLLEETRRRLGATTPTRGNIINILV